MSDDLYFKLSHMMGFRSIPELKKFLKKYEKEEILSELEHIKDKSVEYKNYDSARKCDELIEFYENQ